MREISTSLLFRLCWLLFFILSLLRYTSRLFSRPSVKNFNHLMNGLSTCRLFIRAELILMPTVAWKFYLNRYYKKEKGIMFAEKNESIEKRRAFSKCQETVIDWVHFLLIITIAFQDGTFSLHTFLDFSSQSGKWYKKTELNLKILSVQVLLKYLQKTSCYL